MKTLKAAALALVIATPALVSPALAGGIAEPVIEPEVVAQDAGSSSGGILVPMLLVLLVVAALASNNGGGEI